MSAERDVSAQVVLRAASGARPDAGARITSANVAAWLPSPEAVAEVSSALRGMGFDVGPCVGNSLSIAGRGELFERRFGARLALDGGGARFAEHGHELPAAALPVSIRAHVAAITFTPPPDFGPGAESEQGQPP
jgi:hypothetical protein